MSIRPVGKGFAGEAALGGLRRTHRLAWRGLLIGAGAMLACLAWLLPLGQRDLFNTDEGRYSEIAREMAASQDWLTPRLNGLEYLEKPPLQYWITAAIFSVAGVSEWTARSCTAAAGLLTVLLVWATGRRLWGGSAGDYAALAAAGMGYMLVGSQIVTLDMLLTLCLTAALCAALIGLEPRGTPLQRRRWMLAAWVAIALAVLVKGLIGLVIPGAVAFIYCLAHRDWTLLRRVEPWRGVPLFLLIAAPWFVLVSRGIPDFPFFFFVHEHFDRFLTASANREGPLWYFVPLLLAGTLPWTTVLPRMLSEAWNKGAADPARMLLIWCAFVPAFFSLSQSKLPLYVLPVAPALALMLGRHLAGAPADALRPHAWIGAGLCLLLALVAPMVLNRLGNARTPAELHAAFANWVVAAGLAGAVLSAAAARLAMRGALWAAVATLALSGVLTTQLLVRGYQSYAPARSARELADQLRPQLRASTELFVLKTFSHTLPFYLGRTMTVVGYQGELEFGERQEPQRWLPDLESFEERWYAAPHAMAVAPPALAASLQEQGLEMRVVARTPRAVGFVRP